jgi:DUF971 family protein
LSAEPWPIELRVGPARDRLTITFDNGDEYQLSAEYLRVESPSAEVQGHSPHERQYVPGKQDVRIIAIEPVGHYAARIIFDDGHDSGLYTWGWLRDLGCEHDARWAAYLRGLAAQGLRRE